jgi:hypothetical protein
MSDDVELTRHDHVLMGLVFSLQAAAMQQLGKIQDPMTGEIAIDLSQARATIDVLEMLKVKCRTGTPVDVLRMIDGAVLNLQLNYVDELKKKAAADAPTAVEGVDGAVASDGAAQDTAADPGPSA